jgi:hypothetical protein
MLVRQVRLTRVTSQKPHKKHKCPNKHHHHGVQATHPSSGVDLMNPCRLRGGRPCTCLSEGSLAAGGFSMGGQGLGDRQDRTFGGQRKAWEIEKMHAVGASPSDKGSSTPGRQQ